MSYFAPKGCDKWKEGGTIDRGGGGVYFKCRSLEEVVPLKINMFITAVCLIFLISQK